MQTNWIRLTGGCLLAAWACLAAVDRAGAAEALHWRSNLKQAAEESQRSQKPMLIEITAVWCGYCTKMKKTYKDEQIVRHVNGCFVPVTVDADENQKLVEAVGADALPTTVIVSPDFKLLKKITGYYTPKQLESKLGEVCLANHEIVQSSTTAEQGPLPVRTAQATAPEPAFDGHCLVSLLTERKLRICGTEHSSLYKNSLLCFASAEHKRKFDDNPEKYWPVLGGLCPVNLADEKEAVSGRAISGAIYHDRLWFFSNNASRDKFAGSPSEYVSRIK